VGISINGKQDTANQIGEDIWNGSTFNFSVDIKKIGTNNKYGAYPANNFYKAHDNIILGMD
jgi:hypothetical protein